MVFGLGVSSYILILLKRSFRDVVRGFSLRGFVLRVFFLGYIF